MAAKPQRTDIDMGAFRTLLMQERAQLLGVHRQQRADMDEEIRDLTENELAGYDLNQPGDDAVQMAERDREEALDANAVETLRQIDHALARMEEGSYGICEVTGKPIPVERLRAIPWATMTVEAAEATDLL